MLEENVKLNICIVGLGYVGLPLAVEFGRKINTIGFDISDDRVTELLSGHDSTLEVSEEDLAQTSFLRFTSNPEEIQGANIYIVTVPTPIDKFKRPDLTPLEKASKTIGQVISRGDYIIYESTVYPGATEEICVPVVEKESGLVFNQDFYVGYSPERINPGDKEHGVTKILKVTSGSTPEAAEFVDALYKKVIVAGTHKASSIKVAEAAKVIENTQRDVNIALINELALIFNKMGIDTSEVLEAAGTKWNFLPFRPGLVGGHCIGVDPYYLTHKAQEIGYHPQIILSGRRINDGMGSYVADQVIRLMIQKKIQIAEAKVLVMGLSFKENCPDLRNTRVIDIIEEMENYGAQVEVFDPWVNPTESFREYGITTIEEPDQNRYDAIILTVAHDQFKELGIEVIRTFGKEPHVIFDVKNLFNKHQIDGRL